ncbi:hypothetical protein NDU88_006239 [Pleurodeles waltl]|uniref:Uncharacterized protein n=1 Tax=Pleurodeles waltl TaxID=8319 RepID=A0AAV7WX17_PLEWA|nr:hypothetical protein NDU88_006239 [Pleurodeles waltl]
MDPAAALHGCRCSVSTDVYAMLAKNLPRIPDANTTDLLDAWLPQGCVNAGTNDTEMLTQMALQSCTYFCSAAVRPTARAPRLSRGRSRARAYRRGFASPRHQFVVSKP